MDNFTWFNDTSDTQMKRRAVLETAVITHSRIRLARCYDPSTPVRLPDTYWYGGEPIIYWIARGTGQTIRTKSDGIWHIDVPIRARDDTWGLPRGQHLSDMYEATPLCGACASDEDYWPEPLDVLVIEGANGYEEQGVQCDNCGTWIKEPWLNDGVRTLLD